MSSASARVRHLLEVIELSMTHPEARGERVAQLRALHARLGWAGLLRAVLSGREPGP